MLQSTDFFLGAETFSFSKKSRPAFRYILADCLVPRNNSKGCHYYRGYDKVFCFQKNFFKNQFQKSISIKKTLSLKSAIKNRYSAICNHFKTRSPCNNSPSSSHICYNYPSHLFVGSLSRIGHKKHENLCQ